MKHLQRAISLVLAVLMVFGTAISLAAPEDGDLNREFNLTNDKLVEILVEGSLKAELDQAILNPLVKSDLDRPSIDLFWQVEEDDGWRNTLDGEVFEEGKNYRLAVNVRDLKIQDKEIEGLRLVSEDDSNQVILSIDRGSFSEKEELNFDGKNAKDTNKTETTETIEETKEKVEEPKKELIFDNKTETEDLEDKVNDQTDLNTDSQADENQGEENKEESSKTVDLFVNDDQREENPAVIDETITEETSNEESESQIADEKPTEIIDDQKQNEEAEIIEISPEKEADKEASPKAESTVSFIAYSAPMRAGGSGEGVYLDGVSGDDNNDGSKENPVKTFAKAKELAENKNSDIIVVGTVTINDTQKLSLKEGLRVLRGENFNKYLFEITGSNANVTLTNITIDGNSNENPNIEESLIKVESESKATLNITDGAILRNNKIKDITNTATMGGAVYVKGSTLNMSGGIVEACQATYGGGIYLYKSTMNFTGGAVQNNESKIVIDTAYNQIYSAGGGICAYDGSTINMSGSALVKKNKASEIGGGISLGTNQVGIGNILNMTGGTVEANTAGASGGGIFIQCGYFSGTPSKGYITSGAIINNIMSGEGITQKEFGGAGIYVNGFPGSIKYDGYDLYGTNGELHLKNAIITNNSAKLQGAGLAVCPISDTKIYVKDGAAIYNNNSKDFYLLSDKRAQKWQTHAGEPMLKMSNFMLGEIPYNWKDINNNNSPVDVEKYNGRIRDGLEINLLAGNQLPDSIKQAYGKVLITGNESKTRGGGIGSNGSIIIGTETPTKEIEIKKSWEGNIEESEKPDNINITVFIKDGNKKIYIGVYTLKKSEDYTLKITGLPAKYGDKNIEEVIGFEEVLDGFEPTYSGIEVEKQNKLSFNLNFEGDLINLSPTFTLKASDDTEIKKLQKQAGSRKLLFDDIDLEPKYTNIKIEYYDNDGTLFDTNQSDYILTLDFEGEDTVVIKCPKLKVYKYTKTLQFKDEEGNIKKIDFEYSTESLVLDDANISKVFKLGVTNKKKDTAEIEISGTKTWSDFGAESRPEFITVRLFANDVEVAVKEVRASDDWKYDFGKWSAADNDGKEISYTIKEDPVPGYYTTINGFDIINSREPYEPTPEYVNIRVNKRWIDNDNRNNTRPGSITIELLADGRVVDRATINSANDWGLTFFNMPKYDGAHLIDYTIREVPVEGYRSILTGDMHYGFTLTNELKGEKINIPVRKIWEGKKGAFANVSLYADGKIVYTVSLSDENNWEYIFEGLDRYDANGREIVYTISEASIEGYETKIEGDQDRGFVVTNKSKESPKISISLKKNWVGKKAEKAIVNLYANGEIVYTADLSEENAWSFVFEDLDKLDQNGNEIAYTVEELPIDGYQVNISGSAAEGFVLTNTWTPEEKPPVDVPGKPNKPKKPGLPKTGDGLNKSVYAAMVAIFGGVMVLLGLNEIRKSKRVYEEEK